MTQEERDMVQRVLNIMDDILNETHEDDCCHFAAEYARDGLSAILDDYTVID
jgi:hypothetical protein